MSRRASVYLLLTALVLSAAAAGWIYAGFAQSRAQIAQLRADMVTGEWPLVRARLDDLAGTMGVRRRALAGLAVVEALTGLDRGSAPRAAAAELVYFPLPLLFERALQEERYDGCLRLVEMLRRAGAPAFPEFEAAALLELGRFEEARAVALGRGPSNRIRAAVAAVLAGRPTDVLVRDRSGVLLGKAQPAPGGGFTLEPERGVDRSLVPPPVLAGLGALLPARSVRLTIDRRMSEMALAALGRYRGSIVVVDPSDGSVLVAVSDRRSAAEGRAPALEQMREPASIAKLITVTAALRAGYDVDAVLHDMVCRGALQFEDGPLYCSAVNGPLHGLDRALAVSCNVAFAELGTMVGRTALLDEYRRYGFDREGEDGRYFGRVVEPQGTRRQLGDLSIGLEATTITPVHAALEAATIANGGWMHPPRLYRSTDSFLGLSERSFDPEPGWQVLDERWRPLLTRAMLAVAQPGGTAARVAPRSFPVALKTGTASEPGSGFHVNYIGFGPVPGPRYAFAVRLTHQPSSRRVRGAAFAVTHRLLQGLARGDRRPAAPATPWRPTVVAHAAGAVAGG